jgi:hypothetical protein
LARLLKIKPGLSSRAEPLNPDQADFAAEPDGTK